MAYFLLFSPKPVASKIAANSALSCMSEADCTTLNFESLRSLRLRKERRAVWNSKQKSRSIQCVWSAGRKGHVGDFKWTE